ncbi:hypothetical protein ACROYT_G002973 [Oculina patagonica]
MWRPPSWQITQGFSPPPNQQQMRPGFQTQIPQAAPMQRLITSPGVVPPLQRLGSPPEFRGSFNPATVCQSPPRGITQPSTAQVTNIWSPLQHPSPLSSPRGVTSPVHQPFMPTTLPSPRGISSPVLQSSSFNSPSASWQARSPQPSVFGLNQGPSVMAPTVPSPRGPPVPAQQRLVSPTLLPPRGSPTPTQQPPMSSTLPPPGRFPSSPVQPLVSPTVLSPRTVSSPVLQASPFNSPVHQKPPVAVSFPRPFMSPTSPSSSPRVIPPQTQQQFVRPTLPSPRGVPSQVVQQQSSPFNHPSMQVRNPPPSGCSLNQGSSIAAALDRHIQDKQLRGISSNYQQPNNSISSGLPQPRKESILHNMPVAMTGPSGLRPPIPQQFGGLQPPVSQQFSRLRTPVPQQFSGLRPPAAQQLGGSRPPVPQCFSGLRPPVPRQFSPVRNRMPDFSPINHRSPGGQKTSSPSVLHQKTGFHRDGDRGRERGSRRNFSPGVGGRRSPRVPRCFSPPPPDVERVVKCVVPEEFYTKKQSDQDDNNCNVQGTKKLTELQNRFQKEILNMVSVEDDDNESVNSRQSNHANAELSDVESLVDTKTNESPTEVDESPPKSRLRQKSDASNYAEFLGISDEEINSDEDGSEIGIQGLSDSSSEYDDDDDGDDNEDSHPNGGFDDDDDDDDLLVDEHDHRGPSVADVRRRKMEDLRRLHPELWFNEAGETNDGPVCRCSASDKKQGIRHGVYPGETVVAACDPLTNNADKLYHYWVTVTPHTNFMTENPTIIHFEGKDYTFEGFSMFCHHPLEHVPLCSVIRFNIEYSLHFISQPVPENFCIKDLDLFSQFLFYKILELADWDLKGDMQDSCQRYHFMPRFVHRTTDHDNSMKDHKLLSMSQVLSHVLDSAKLLVKSSDLTLSADKLEEYSKSCVNSIVMNPDKKPVALRVDDLQFCKDTERLSKGKMYPYIVHHSIRPVQMSFAGDPKYQKLQKSYVKLRSLISNTPVPSRKNQDKLVKLKIELEKMRLTGSMRRDVVVEVSSRGMIKTGLKSDICQHALLLPVLVHHVRYHMCLQTLDEKMGYVFKDRCLLQLALTHPSYHLNFGMNPDHARNSLSNCGVKQPRYGDRKIRHLHTRKKGITQLIRVMSNLGKMEEYQSMIRHNERLEFLGDAVLELISSVHLYFMLPSKTEGGLAMYRSALVQNRHLAQLAKKLGLSDYMQFSHGPDLCMEEDLNHAMANCFEALLGAMYLESGLTSATVLFTNTAFEEEELRDVWTNLPKHPLQAQQPDGDRHLISSSSLLQKLEEFEQASGIEFTHIRLLARAFTHPQVGFNNLTLGNNQRMEFLGDSVLQFVVSVYLFKHFPEHHEGHLTLLRSSLVNHRIQATLARELGLDKLINFGGQGVKAFREKLLADILEAFVAALYVDKGLRYVEVFCRVCLFPRLEEFIINQDWMDAKSQLQQCCLTSREQGKTPDLPQYKVLQNKGPAHHKHYTVAVYYKGRRLGSGEGKSIQQAEMAAAKDALTSHYFPELARQKRLLDRKHQGRRRNYWNKVPRKEREKDEQDEEDAEFEPCWEEKEAFEENEDVDEKEDENNSQEDQNENSSQEKQNENSSQEEENEYVEVDIDVKQDENNSQEVQNENSSQEEQTESGSQEEDSEPACTVVEDDFSVA